MGTDTTNYLKEHCFAEGDFKDPEFGEQVATFCEFQKYNLAVGHVVSVNFQEGCYINMTIASGFSGAPVMNSKGVVGMNKEISSLIQLPPVTIDQRRPLSITAQLLAPVDEIMFDPRVSTVVPYSVLQTFE